jgi:hypothetical protein
MKGISYYLIGKDLCASIQTYGRPKINLLTNIQRGRLSNIPKVTTLGEIERYGTSLLLNFKRAFKVKTSEIVDIGGKPFISFDFVKKVIEILQQ